MEQIVWLTRVKKNSTSDVTIAERKHAEKTLEYVMRFRNGFEKVFSTGYTKIGINKVGNRVYFSEAPERFGWKLGKQMETVSNSRIVVTDRSSFACFKRFVGDFEAYKVNDKVFYIGEKKLNENIEEEVCWFTKFSEPKNRAKVDRNDVSVTLRASGKIAITLRNGIYQELKSDYIRIGLSTDGKKLYFLAANNKSGWKLSKFGDTSATIALSGANKKLYVFIGDYDIEISDDDLLYIDSRNRK